MIIFENFDYPKSSGAMLESPPAQKEILGKISSVV